ncbi:MULTISPECIES: hypothetical protein [Nitrosomonas]|uniref:hypothetical protein n=1 Tax=Nitrosomonas TaxID=914 RepID=UPI000310C9B2|nr:MULTISPECIES: hypothetical protein [Nitrosomonas]
MTSFTAKLPRISANLGELFRYWILEWTRGCHAEFMEDWEFLSGAAQPHGVSSA